MRIDLLGPMRGWSGDVELDLGPVRQQALLAVLALRANQVVTPDELLDAVWGDRLPASGVKIIPPYIYRVRRMLGEPDCLGRTRDGYVLHLEPDALDLSRFESAAGDGRQARARGDLERAASLLAEGLAEYRGEPLMGLPGPGLVIARHQLSERRLQALAERIGLDLDCGRHADVVAELTDLVDHHPLNEQFAGLKMHALFRTGRQAEALDTYTRTRTTLVEQLGVEPGPELRAVHQTVLGGKLTGRDELPRDIADFIGRDAELTAVLGELSKPSRPATPIVVIDGMAGVGKTALAIRAARRLASEYPDGRLFLDLHGFTQDQRPTPPSAAVARLLRAIGVPADQIPMDTDERSALWRAELAERRLLIVLDNAAGSDQVQPLLPGSPICGVIVTSRRQLTALDAAQRVPLDILSPREAQSLLVTIIGANRATGRTTATLQLVEACGRLPLAVRIAGARLRHRPGWSIERLSQRLTKPGPGLVELSVEGGNVGQAFDLSYDHLPVDQQRMFRLLGLIPGPDIDSHAAAALNALCLTEADRLLNALVDANLLLTPTPGRFAFHDLLRVYARQSADAESPSERAAALTRLHAWYLHSAANARQATAAPLLMIDIPEPPPEVEPATFEDSTEAVAWLDCERQALVDLVRDAANRGRHPTAYQIAHVLNNYLSNHFLVDDLLTVMQIAMDSAERTGHSVAVATCANHLGMAFGRFLGDNVRAMAHFEHAVELFDDAGDQHGLAVALGSLGTTLWQLGRPAEAVVRGRQSVDLTHSLGRPDLEASSLNNLAVAYINLGNYDEAVDACHRAVEIHRARRNARGLPHALDTLGQALTGRGDYDDAIAHYNEALELFNETGNRWNTCATLANLGRAQHASGLVDEARTSWQQALRIYDEIGATDTNELRRSDLVPLGATSPSGRGSTAPAVVAGDST